MSEAQNNVFFDVLTPVSFLIRSVSIYADKTAVVYEDKRYTYQEFYNRVNRLASALGKIGVAKGDKVAFICPNTPPMLEAHYAVPMIGAALVSVNIRLSAREVVYIINHSDAKVLVVDNEFAGLIKPVIGELSNVKTVVNICDVSAEKPLEGMEYEEFLQTGSDAPIAPVVDDEYQIATINYTSGTTGLPKGVMYHHRGAFLNALGEAVEFSLTSQSNYLWTLPMFHCNGWCYTWGVTAMGGVHVCLRRVVPEEIYRLIEKESISHLCAAPTVLIGMANYPGAKDVKFSRKLEVITAGAPPAPAIIKSMEELGVNVTQVYGLTEVYGPHSICEWQTRWDGLSIGEKSEIKARQGVPYVTSLHMDVVDPVTMKPVPRDGRTIGEIVMRGNNVMLGYYKDPKATADAFAGGWFHSGDLAAIHPDNYVQIMDRKKDIIISGGENISTVEVENAIYQHPDVLEVAVVSTPDEKWGEVPKAFVVLKQGRTLTEKDIINHCKENLARFKAPKSVEFGELPKTATGKIQKFKLRDKEWAGRDRKVN
ncbi:MAG: long-chain-fatty-acid--CoA ligase [Syntrophobacteraceae bacterium]|nr:long-chain-fatty-acid--CoA ligase [Syntrophobacteraceae bacterium]